MKILLTCPPRGGKSTILTKLQSNSNIDFVGCIVKEELCDGKRIGFCLNYIPSNHKELLASSAMKLSDTYLSKYSINTDEIENNMIPFIRELAKQKGKCILFDEIGRMQNTSPKGLLRSPQFQNAIDELLESDNNVVATIVYDEPWATRYKDKTKYFVISVTEQNRDFVPALILQMLLAKMDIDKNAFYSLFDNGKFNELMKMIG